MTVALRRARLMDTFLVALLIVLLSAVHYAMLHSQRGRQFNKRERQQAYEGLLVASWPLLGVGALPLLALWFTGRSIDRVNLSTGSPKHMAAVMIASSMVGLGCTLVAIAELLWIIDIGFGSFHIVILLSIVSFVLLIWITLQVFNVVRQAAAVRRHLLQNPHSTGPQPGDFDFQSDSERQPDSKDNPFV